jgi:hypothetical protein
MQLIVAGSSGFLATEVIRQSLYLPKITSVIALARRSISAPEGLGADADASKLQSVVVKEYDEYPDEVKKQFANADACIWYYNFCYDTIVCFFPISDHICQDCCRYPIQIA